MNDLDTTTIPFRLRGVEGQVTVQYGVNEDPVRWGYTVLDLEWFRPELVRGFPVMQAIAAYPTEGYAADMGWLQVVRYVVRDPGEEDQQTVFDVPPQLSGTETPYLAFGVRPTALDAPSIDAQDATWDADTFLVYTRCRVKPHPSTDLRLQLGHPPTRWQAHAALGRALDGVGEDEGAAAAVLEAADTIRGFAETLTPERARPLLASSPVQEILALATA